MVKNILSLLVVGFCSVGFAQQPGQYSITQKTSDFYQASLSLNEGLVFEPRDVSFVSGTITFKDTYSKSPDRAELITEAFAIDLNGKEAPLAISEGEHIWVEASIIQPKKTSNQSYVPWEVKPQHQPNPWEIEQFNLPRLYIKITSASGIVLAEVTIEKK
ncbi:MAG TPA: hypothetical protein PKC21_09685 [Oligoflexia bacterium]|nr:hypothetical protein [Oligoflexia bacterium]HMR25609.1 hypothetical protein [Oligoflexia bacterium]